MGRAGLIYVGLTRGRGTQPRPRSSTPSAPLTPRHPRSPEAIARPANAKTAHATRDELGIEQGFDPPPRTPAEHWVESREVEIQLRVRRTAPSLGL